MIEKSPWLVAIYKVFLGLFVVAFVGIGIAAFYPEPSMPEALMYAGGPLPTEVQPVAHAYHDAMALYNRDVAIIAAVAAVAILTISLTVVRTISVFSDGLMLGGLLTFAYSIMRGFGAEDNRVLFVIVSVGLAVALGLGYVRFLRPAPPTASPAEEPEVKDEARAA
jgi:hypothetical protein